jgi:hypothetical protein
MYPSLMFLCDENLLVCKDHMDYTYGQLRYQEIWVKLGHPIDYQLDAPFFISNATTFSLKKKERRNAKAAGLIPREHSKYSSLL